MKETSMKNKIILGITWGILIFIFTKILYNLARSQRDFINFMIITGILMLSGFILDKFQGKGKINNYLSMFIFSILMFFYGYISDTFLVIKFTPILWIPIMIILYAMDLWKRHKKEQKISYKKLLVFILSSIIVFIALFNIFDESFLGTTRAERMVKRYLFEEKMYGKSDIRDVGRINTDYVYVIFSNEQDIAYVYTIENNKVIQKRVEGNASKEKGRLLKHKESC